MPSVDHILGIDLGTTNSVMALIEGENPRVIPNAEGQNKTPSVVSFLPNGDVVVGEIARRQAATNVQRTIFSVKRLMGRQIEELGDDLDFFTCPIVSKDGLAALDIGGRVMTPSEVSALILKKLRDDAEAYLGHEISKAIITVPAYFDDRQRHATVEAGRLAGLEVLRIINEPTAAAMAYGLNKTAEERIAVFDFGGGTFDLSVLDISGGAFEVVTSLGDSHLGGDDIDHAIVDHMLEEFHRQHGIDLGADDLAIRRLKEAAEKAKCELSGTSSTLISLPFIGQTPDGQPVHLEMTLNRDVLEAMAEPFVQRCLDCCRQALSDAGLAVRDIARVILVGGSTRIPLVQEAVEDFFGIPPDRGVNPDEIVAQGAATQGGVMSGALEEVVLLEVTPFALGIETKGDQISKVIDKNATIPIKAAKVFTTTEDDQPLVNIHVVQGEGMKASEAVSLGKFTLTDIAAAKAGVPRIRVTFTVNADGIVEIEAEDLASGQAKSLRILHTFERRGPVAIGGDAEESRQRRPNRWRDRRRRLRTGEGLAKESLTGVPLNARVPAPGSDAVSPMPARREESGPQDVDFAAAATNPCGPPHLSNSGAGGRPDMSSTEANRLLAEVQRLLERRATDTIAHEAYRAAVRVLEERLRQTSDDAVTLRLLGEVQLMLGNFTEARNLFQRHVRRHPDLTSEIRSCYDRLLTLCPQAMEARLDRARVIAKMGDLDAAIADLENLGGAETRSAAAIELMIELLRQRVEQTGDSATEFKLVKLHLQQNDLDEAIAILQRLVNRDSCAERAGKVLGLCFWQKHMHYLAWQRFRALPFNDEIKDILYRLSQDMEAAEDWEGARQVLDHLAQRDPGHRDVAQRLESVRTRVRQSRGKRPTSQSDVFGTLNTPESQIDDVRFSILGEINRGSMGVIYKAKDNVLDEIVAIKVLNAFLCSDPQAVDRFKREARAAKRLSHPNIVRIHDMFEKGTKKFLSMEFIDGSDLKSILRTQGRIDPAEVIRVASEVCIALAYAHRLEIIHRDIKPANIMITQRTRAVKITDFGIAKSLSPADRSSTGTLVMGTPLYMAPEQVEGKPVDARTDLYSLGVLMYELVSGKPPFNEGNIEYHHLHTEPEPPADCPSLLRDVIMRCLAKPREERFQSADELLAQLKGLSLAGTDAGLGVRSVAAS
ncbi:MAG: molecular chaperone DnaK [Candidatus Sumerlaeia bacterium]|nr:molecular chaperone DnaK [Candidatus Sumerlaeia bacterium]